MIVTGPPTDHYCTFLMRVQDTCARTATEGYDQMRTPVPPAVAVRLPLEVARDGARRAALRKRASRNAERNPSWSTIRTRTEEWDQECGGLWGEMAAGLYYGRGGAGSVNTMNRGGDLTGGHEVRHANAHYKRLLLRDDHLAYDLGWRWGKPTRADERIKPDAVYVFVTGVPLTLYVRGWILGRDALAVGTWENPHGDRPCLFVDTSRLHPPDTLVRAPVDLSA